LFVPTNALVNSVTGTPSITPIPTATSPTIPLQSTIISPSTAAATSHSLTGAEIGGIVGGIIGGFALVFIVLGFLFIKGKRPHRDQDQGISGAANVDRTEDKEESYYVSQG